MSPRCHLMTVSHGFKERSAFNNDDLFFRRHFREGVVPMKDEECSDKRNEIFCNISDCRRVFRTQFRFQCHFNSLHRYSCSQCNCSNPSDHLLDLHLLECHSSYFSVQSKTKSMYSCFLQKCKKRFYTAKDRKTHCISLHNFSPNFKFLINKSVE